MSGRKLGEVCKEFVGQSTYGLLKQTVANEVAVFLQKFQADLAKVDDKTIIVKLESSESLMSKQAKRTLLNVQKAVGLRP